MPATPKRAGRQPYEGAQFLSQVLAENVRASRQEAQWSQDGLAERMADLGHGWVRATVSEVERGGRNVTVDELGALAIVLGTTIGDLLDPAAWERPTEQAAIDVGAAPDGAYLIRGAWTGLWVRSEVVYRLSRWIQGPAELLNRPISDRARELAETERAAWAATSEPKEGE
jgi:transcriptional regulator with XRE-family HTH domain